MDDAKKTIIVGYLIAIVLSVLIVPWKLEVYKEGNYRGKINEGYGFVLSPPIESHSSIDFSRLFIELVLITAAAGIIYTLRDKIFKKQASIKSADIKNKKPPSYRKVGTGDNVTWAFNREGKVSGRVTREPEGKTVIGLGPNADFTTGLMATLISFTYHLKDEEKKILADWGVVPAGQWTAKHREKFALALMHHFCDLKESGALVPDEFKGVLERLPSGKELPPLDRPLTNEVRRLFNGLFAGLGILI